MVSTQQQRNARASTTFHNVREIHFKQAALLRQKKFNINDSLLQPLKSQLLKSNEENPPQDPIQTTEQLQTTGRQLITSETFDRTYRWHQDVEEKIKKLMDQHKDNAEKKIAKETEKFKSSTIPKLTESKVVMFIHGEGIKKNKAIAEKMKHTGKMLLKSKGPFKQMARSGINRTTSHRKEKDHTEPNLSMFQNQLQKSNYCCNFLID